MAVAQLQLGKRKEALESWRNSLLAEEATPKKLRNIANFLLAMLQLDRAQPSPSDKETVNTDFLDGVDIPAWPKDLPIDRDGQAIILAVAGCLAKLDRDEVGQRLLESGFAGLSNDPDFVAGAVSMMLDAGNAGKALSFLRRLTSAAHKDDAALLIAHAAAALASACEEEAKALSLRAREASPIHLSPKMPDQRLLIGVLNHIPDFIKKPVTPFALHFSANIPAALASRMNEEFRFLSIFPQAQSTKAALASLPRPQPP